MKRKEEKENSNYVIFAVLFIGSLLMIFQWIKHAPIYIESAFTSLAVQHPVTFRPIKYQALLQKFVKNDLVDYAAMKNSPELHAAVDELKLTSPDKIVTEDDQLAYWINAYNLTVLNLICEKYPVRSVKFLANDYSGELFLIGGKPWALQDIYVGQVMPRIQQAHAACIFLVCQGAVGYPPLQDHEYDKDNIKIEAETAIYKFVNDPTHAKYDPTTGAFALSPFFEWTKNLYESKWGSPFNMVNSYRDNKINMRSENLTKTYDLPFNWRLNDTRLSKLR